MPLAVTAAWIAGAALTAFVIVLTAILVAAAATGSFLEGTARQRPCADVPAMDGHPATCRPAGRQP
jgi:hypothetical protein